MTIEDSLENIQSFEDSKYISILFLPYNAQKINKGLVFFRNSVRKKWPLRGSNSTDYL